MRDPPWGDPTAPTAAGASGNLIIAVTTRTAYHTEIAGEFLVKGRAHLDDGDLLQASEKGWGAAAQIVKAVADARAWRHQTHADLYRVVNRLANELADERLQVLFHSANALHQNFYEGWMPAESVAAGLSAVEEFVGRLGDLLG